MLHLLSLLTVVSFVPSSTIDSMPLYSDEYVRGLARRDVDADIAVGVDKGLSKQPILDVVPPGQTKVVSEILAELNLKPSRIYRFETRQENNVIFLEAQISDSYRLSIMTDARRFGAVDSQEEYLTLAGYGVRILAAPSF